jgi:hypothetical protein
VQDDDLARVQRSAIPGLHAVARYGGAPARQGPQPGAIASDNGCADQD